ncbi:MAG: mannose-1-phosphate guanylyltransferase, partial [Terriglobia bacterium]
LPAYAIVIAGGYGTRFWPASRRARPKQFLPLVGKQSLLQQTYRRLRRIFPPGRIYVVGSAEHRRLLRQQLPDVPTGRLLLEPVGRNTAAAIALAAEHIGRDLGHKPDAVLAVFPADHAIGQEARFLRIVRAALKAAADEDRMIVLGIPPTHPHTGYGYIERSRVLKQARGQEVFAVKRFTEKPDRRTATRYLRTRRYYWNAGMFFWRLSTFNRLLTRHLPRTRQAMDSLARSLAKRNYTASLSRAYRRLENISLDYALAEPAAARGQVRLLECAAGWSDLGSWSAAYEWQARKGENVTAGPHFLLDAHGNWLDASGKFVAAIGVDNLVVVETPDALLLCPRERTQEVGKVVDYLRKKKAKRWL